jgi:hypothetical protein
LPANMKLNESWLFRLKSSTWIHANLNSFIVFYFSHSCRCSPVSGWALSLPRRTRGPSRRGCSIRRPRSRHRLHRQPGINQHPNVCDWFSSCKKGFCIYIPIKHTITIYKWQFVVPIKPWKFYICTSWWHSNR